MGSFSAGVLETIEKQLAEVNAVCSAITVEAFTSVVNYSPMGNAANRDAPFADGLLINQWYVSKDSPSSLHSSTTSDNGSGSLSRIAKVTSANYFYKKDSSIFLTNNTPYIDLAETTGWLSSINPAWKNATPFAMVDRTVTKMKAKT